MQEPAGSHLRRVHRRHRAVYGASPQRVWARWSTDDMGVEQMLGGDEPGTRFPPDLPSPPAGI